MTNLSHIASRRQSAAARWRHSRATYSSSQAAQHWSRAPVSHSIPQRNGNTTRLPAATEDLAPAAEEEEEDVLEELSAARHVIVEKDFLPFAGDVRAVFDQRFQNPRSNQPQRFMWDYWHVPNQYTLIRTQAHVYFPEAVYRQLEDALLQYGETQLGCRAISPVWLSYYVDGCSQELHTDSPHGPFAFVLSLTPQERKFKGGETMILQPRVLQYWEQYEGTGLEMPSLMTLVEPHYNQLLVFDPRFPHGVRPVYGTRDPQEARLVLHGWFTEPSPFFTGGLTSEQAEDVLNSALDDILEELAELPAATGVLILRLHVEAATGNVTDVTFLADTLVPLPAAESEAGDVRALIQHCVHGRMSAAVFPKCKAGDTDITYPMIFE